MFQKYEPQVQEFCDWIDEWKKANEWDALTQPRIEDGKVNNVFMPKFHDYPYSVQLGIWLEFLATREWEDAWDCLHYCQVAIAKLSKGIEYYLLYRANETTTDC